MHKLNIFLIPDKGMVKTVHISRRTAVEKAIFDWNDGRFLGKYPLSIFGFLGLKSIWITCLRFTFFSELKYLENQRSRIYSFHTNIRWIYFQR